MKESMRMMGMTDVPYWLSWFTYYTLLNTSTALLATLTVKINCFERTSFGMIFLVIWGFGEALWGQIVFVQALFRQSKYAGIMSTVVYFCLAFLNLPMVFADMSDAYMYTVSVIPQVNICQIVWRLFEADSRQQAFTFDTDIEGKASTFFLLYLVGFLFFTSVGVYFECVLPSEFGNARHPCFMFLPSTYKGCCSSKRELTAADIEIGSSLAGDDLELRSLLPENYEAASQELVNQEKDQKFLRIENLQKVYTNGFQAVKGINLKIYQDQIFALLG